MPFTHQSQPRTVLVTGGAGFVGSHLVEALVGRGDRVRVLDDLSTGSRANLAAVADRIEFIRGSVTEVSALQRALVGGVDYIFHLAALPSVARSLEKPLETHEACTTGTLHILHAARQGRVKRVVYASSSSVYGDSPKRLRQEADHPSPVSPYAAAKLAGEHYCRSFSASLGLETVCLRYFNVFGPRQDPRGPYAAVIPRFIAALRAARQPVIYGDGLQSRDFCYVDNVVQANLLAAEAEGVSGRVFNVGCGHSTSLLGLLDQLNDLCGTDVQPRFEDPRAGDVRHSQAEITLARKDLGYEPRVDVREGLGLLLAHEGLGNRT